MSTPGPWCAERGERGQWRVFCPTGEVVCTIDRWTEETDAADARLIESAPDLAAALENAAKFFDAFCKSFELAEPDRDVKLIRAMVDTMQAALAKLEKKP